MIQTARWAAPFVVLTALVTGIVAGSAHAQNPGGYVLSWSPLLEPGPTPRWRHAMCFDRDRGVLVVFGGDTGEGDTWEWTSATNTWRRASITGPAPRGGHAMVYDARRKVSVLLGGGGPTPNISREVWEWDGRAWTKRSGAAELPDDRNGVAACYDRDRERVLVYGGTNAAVPNAGAMLEYDGATWTSRTSPGNPGAQVGHAMTYDSVRKLVVLRLGSGGLGSAQWEPVSGTWQTQIGGNDANSAVAFDESRGVTVVTRFNNPATYLLGGAANVIIPQSSVLGYRNEHCAAYDSVGQRVLVFGGLYDTQYKETPHEPSNDLIAFDGAAWTLLNKPSTLPVRISPTSAYDAARGQVIYYGGFRDTMLQGWTGAQPAGDALVLTDAGWTPLVPAPPALSHKGSKMLYDPGRGVTMIFGEQSAVLELGPAGWSTPQSSGSLLNYSAAVTYDSARSRLVAFGGRRTYIFGALTSETWYSRLGGWWLGYDSPSPPAMVGGSMAFHAASGVCVLAGGANNGTYSSGTWTHDETTWRPIAGQTPAPRTGAAMVYDPRVERCVLVGGFGPGGVALSDAWGFDGSGWSPITSIGLPGLGGATMSFDAGKGRYVLAGGAFASGLNADTAQTWIGTLRCTLADLTDNAGSGPPDARLTASDIVAFFGDYFAGCTPGSTPCSRADITGASGAGPSDGVLSASDVVTFFGAFFAGCP